MDLREAIERCPYLASPAALAHVDTNGRWRMRPHLSVLNRELMDVGFGATDRLGVHMPFQHGKTLLASQYFSAWLLLLCPWMRIILGSHSERYSGSIGGKVRDVIERFGGPMGVKLKRDSKAKNEWNIDSNGGFDGGMVCKGFTGGINGRACDLLLLDDVIKNATQAMSLVVSETQWEWYQTVAYGRLGPIAPIVMVTTRWVKNDLPGRIYAEARDTGEKWKTITFKAIAEKNDPLGRKPGEALWPERVPLKRLELIKRKRGRWFKACWQQEPEEETGMHFRPRRVVRGGEVVTNGWPRYTNIGDAWTLPRGISRDIFRHAECSILIALDWAMGKKKDSDRTAIVPACLTPDGRLLILNCVNERIRLEDNAKRLDEVCEIYPPDIVAGDDDMLSSGMVMECRRWRHIPEIKRMPISGNNKLVRAQAAIIRGEHGLICLPAPRPDGSEEDWVDDFCEQLSSFTGIEDEHDDVPDAVGILGRLADQLNPAESRGTGEGPILISEGRGVW